MPNFLLGKIPQSLKSLYYAENELRRALFKGVVLRSGGARARASGTGPPSPGRHVWRKERRPG